MVEALLRGPLIGETPLFPALASIAERGSNQSAPPSTPHTFVPPSEIVARRSLRGTAVRPWRIGCSGMDTEAITWMTQASGSAASWLSSTTNHLIAVLDELLDDERHPGLGVHRANGSGASRESE